MIDFGLLCTKSILISLFHSNSVIYLSLTDSVQIKKNPFRKAFCICIYRKFFGISDYRKNPLTGISVPRSEDSQFFIILLIHYFLLSALYILCFSAAKNAFVSLTITPLNTNNAIIFGIAISPLKISAIVHTALTVIYGPINTARM